MSLVPSVSRHAGWVVTQKGHEDLLYLPVCLCEVHLVGLLLECSVCGTVYGNLREQTGQVVPFNRKAD